MSTKEPISGEMFHDWDIRIILNERRGRGRRYGDGVNRPGATRGILRLGRYPVLGIFEVWIGWLAEHDVPTCRVNPTLGLAWRAVRHSAGSRRQITIIGNW